MLKDEEYETLITIFEKIWCAKKRVPGVSKINRLRNGTNADPAKYDPILQGQVDDMLGEFIWCYWHEKGDTPPFDFHASRAAEITNYLVRGKEKDNRNVKPFENGADYDELPIL